MIITNIGESFIVSVALWDEDTGENAPDRTDVYYDIRDASDAALAPPINGTLDESGVTSGIYYTTVSIDTSGEYICYVTCSGFFSSSEEIIINAENIYDLVKQNRHYNLSVEETVRPNIGITPSQTIRKVEVGSTDYITTKIKGNLETDWDTTLVTGKVYAWYETLGDTLPNKMADDGV